jgi:coiled-coil domain-containing protein 40
LDALELEVRVKVIQCFLIKQEGADREMKRREEAGVQLYNLQQEIAKIQTSYEAGEENFLVIKALRADSERILDLVKKEYEAERGKFDIHSQNLDAHQAEMENIQSTLKQVELYKEELRSKLLIAKRTSLKTEKDLVVQEIEKKRQDYFIDKLAEQLKKLQNKKLVYETQMEIQKKETKAALKTLGEASTEMEVIELLTLRLSNLKRDNY